MAPYLRSPTKAQGDAVKFTLGVLRLHPLRSTGVGPTTHPGGFPAGNLKITTGATAVNLYTQLCLWPYDSDVLNDSDLFFWTAICKMQ